MNKYLISIGLLLLVFFFDAQKVICDWPVSDKIQAPSTDLNLDKGGSTSAIPILIGVVSGVILTATALWWIDYSVRPETAPQILAQVSPSADFSTPELYTVPESEPSEKLKKALTELGAARAEPGGSIMTKATPITRDLVKEWVNASNTTDTNLGAAIPSMNQSEEKLDSI
jgi:hypothetical protein